MVRVSNPGRGKKLFSSPKFPDQLWDPWSLIFDGINGYYPGKKWPGCDLNYWPESSARVKNEWSYTSSPPKCLHGVDREIKLDLIFTCYLCMNMLLGDIRMVVKSVVGRNHGMAVIFSLLLVLNKLNWAGYAHIYTHTHI